MVWRVHPLRWPLLLFCVRSVLTQSCYNSRTNTLTPAAQCPEGCCYYGARCGTASECANSRPVPGPSPGPSYRYDHGPSIGVIVGLGLGITLTVLLFIACWCRNYRRRRLAYMGFGTGGLATPQFQPQLGQQQQTMAIQVPPNAAPGTQFAAMTPTGQQLMVIVPPGASPGSIMQVPLPVTTATVAFAAQASQQMPQGTQAQQPSALPPTAMVAAGTDVPMAMPVSVGGAQPPERENAKQNVPTFSSQSTS